MKMIRNLAIAGCSVLLLTQCATQDEVRELNYQIRAVNQKVEEVRTKAVGTIQKRQASSVSKIDQVEEETLRLKSRLEESEHLAGQFREKTGQDLAALHKAVEQLRAENEEKIRALEQKVDQLSAAFTKVQQERIRAAEERAREAARRAEAARKRVVVAATGSPVKVRPERRKVRVGSGKVVSAAAGTTATGSSGPAPSPSVEKSQGSVQVVTTPDTTAGPFSRAMALYKAKKYKDAYRMFEQVLAGNPKGAKAAETLFYMGECLYNQGEYDLAILDYQKVISNHAQDPHTPAALLKQGMSFEKLTDHETAKIIYKKLIKDYAGSPEAATARKRLENL